MIGETLTPSQKATVKYFLVVSLLFLLQIVMGIITAHYGVEGGGFYGIPLSDYLPYVVTRTWHTQLGIFWIATAWLAAGLFIAPYICGYEPKKQKLGVDAFVRRAARRRARFDGGTMGERDAQTRQRAICGFGSDIRVTNTSISAEFGRRRCLSVCFYGCF